MMPNDANAIHLPEVEKPISIAVSLYSNFVVEDRHSHDSSSSGNSRITLPGEARLQQDDSSSASAWNRQHFAVLCGADFRLRCSLLGLWYHSLIREFQQLGIASVSSCFLVWFQKCKALERSLGSLGSLQSETSQFRCHNS